MVTSDPHQVIQALQTVSIHVPDAAGAQARYRSVILGSTPEEEIIIDLPAVRGQEIDIAPDTMIGLQIAVPNGAWRWSVRVRGRVRIPRPALRLSWPAEAGKLQRRDHFRIGVALPAEVSFFSIVGDQPQRSTVVGETVDLSAGGVRIHLADPVHLQANTDIEVQLHLPDGTVECAARVLRLGPYEGEADGASCWIAAEFTDLPSAVSRAITRFLFNASCQRRHARVG